MFAGASADKWIPTTSSRMASGKLVTFKRVRIGVLLAVLVAVAGGTYYQRTLTTNWLRPLQVTIHPINGDRDSRTAAFIRKLAADDYEIIGRFFREEAEAYQLPYAPILNIRLESEIAGVPPAPPPQTAGRFAIGRWSLALRKWVYEHTGSIGLDARHIRLFVIYQQGAKNRALSHSYGLQKGLIGVVNAFADENQKLQNKVVITHELLHTLGATDKYDRFGMPIHPQGYAEPDKQPLYPQEFAEIMAGRYAVSDSEAEIPQSLDQSVIGPYTANEINW
jgi:hypothetical protein